MAAKKKSDAKDKQKQEEPQETDGNTDVGAKEGEVEEEDFGFDGQYDTLEAFDAPDPDFESHYDEAGLTRQDEEKKPPEGPRFSASRQFVGWLRDQNMSVLVPTHSDDRLFLFSLQKNGRLLVMHRKIPGCTAVAPVPNGFVAATDHSLWRFENMLEPGKQHEGFDRIFVPRHSHVYGGMHVHDMGINRGGQPLLLSTSFNCLATVQPDSNFVPLWKPSFISDLRREDRCHLSGLAMEQGRPRFITAFAETDEPGGWKDRLLDGGIVIDVRTNEVVARGLGMPHSPRIYRNKLWLLNSATGYFGSLDLDTEKFEPMTFCNGFPRGLVFYGNFALVGLSRPQDEEEFKKLPIAEELEKRGVEPKCGISVIDLRTGDQVHWARMENGVDQVYNLAVVPQARSSRLVGFEGDEVKRMIKLGKPRPPGGPQQAGPQQAGPQQAGPQQPGQGGRPAQAPQQG